VPNFGFNHVTYKQGKCGAAAISICNIVKPQKFENIQFSTIITDIDLFA